MVWDKNRPISSNPPREAPAFFHENYECLEDGINREHTYPGAKGSTAGQHKPGACKVLKVDTTANLGAGEGVENAISYDTTKNLLMRDTGSALSSMTVRDIEPGTKMYFYQNTAPAGWTIDATPADAILAVKGGSNAYNVNGGSQAGTWTQPNHTHTGPSHTHTGPSHTHSVPGGGWGVSTGTLAYRLKVSIGGTEHYTSGNQASSAGGTGATSAGGTGATSADGTPITYRPLAQVGIICERD